MHTRRRTHTHYFAHSERVTPFAVVLMRYVGLIVLLVTMLAETHAQGIGEYLGGEDVLYAETKQVNQFFRRFNGEEDAEGERYYPKDEFYRDVRLRQKYLDLLFDEQNRNLSGELKKEFIDDVNSTSEPQYLDFHGGSWFAEVQATFEYQGKEEKATLFLKLQEEKVGSKWILTKCHFAPFAKLFSSDTTGGKEFLHPLSHELDFMNLRKAFQDKKQKIDQFTERGYQPDYLSILLYELKKSNVRFKTVADVKFHFFQVEGWYFQLARFNRSGL